MPPFNSFQFDGACYYLRWSTDCLLFCLRLCFFLYIFVALSRKISNFTKLGIVWIELKGEPLYSFFFFCSILSSFYWMSVVHIDAEYKWVWFGLETFQTIHTHSHTPAEVSPERYFKITICIILFLPINQIQFKARFPMRYFHSYMKFHQQ